MKQRNWIFLWILLLLAALTGMSAAGTAESGRTDKYRLSQGKAGIKAGNTDDRALTAYETRQTAVPVFRLPDALRTIEENAFAGTAFENGEAKESASGPRQEAASASDEQESRRSLPASGEKYGKQTGVYSTLDVDTARALPAEWESGVSLEIGLQIAQLPDSLRIIGDSSFEGTAMVMVELPDSLVAIGERAFADIASLRNVYIPASIRSIGSTAFAGSGHVTLVGFPNGYAREWAKENRIPFSAIPVLCASSESVSQQAAGRFENAGLFIDSGAGSEKAPQTWKRFTEYKTEQYKTELTGSVQGRSPPTAG